MDLDPEWLDMDKALELSAREQYYSEIESAKVFLAEKHETQVFQSMLDSRISTNHYLRDGSPAERLFALKVLHNLPWRSIDGLEDIILGYLDDANDDIASYAMLLCGPLIKNSHDPSLVERLLAVVMQPNRKPQTRVQCYGLIYEIRGQEATLGFFDFLQLDLAEDGTRRELFKADLFEKASKELEISVTDWLTGIAHRKHNSSRTVATDNLWSYWKFWQKRKAK